MKVATGKVVGGKVVLDDTFAVSPEEERALLEAIAQADCGQVVSWETLREQLRRSA